jgi:hypothetical protein
MHGKTATLYDSCHNPTHTAAMTATTPAPDCAADGCKGLRIIDANAEAYRYKAMPPRS